MNTNQVRAQAATIINMIGFALTIVALGKFFGVQIPIRGDASQTALVAIACILVR